MPLPPRLTRADRKSLLLGTALVSTLLIGSLLAPMPASAQSTTDCSDPGPTPIRIVAALTDPEVCVNTERRDGTGGYLAIEIDVNTSIDLVTSGRLYSENLGGIFTATTGSGRYIDIFNSGAIYAYGDGIRAITRNGGDIEIVNEGRVETVNGYGIVAYVQLDNSRIDIFNSGDIIGANHGIFAYNFQAQSPILIENSGAISTGRDGIKAYTGFPNVATPNSGITIRNSGRIEAGYDGIHVDTSGAGSSILIENDAAIYAGISGINADTGAYNLEPDSDIVIRNSGRIEADNDGIQANTYGPQSSILIENAAAIYADNNGIVGYTAEAGSGLIIRNSGGVDAGEDAIVAETIGLGSFILIYNSGTVRGAEDGIGVETRDDNSYIRITNSGTIASRDEAIEADTEGEDSPVTIINDGNITSREQEGISSDTQDDRSSITILNRGSVVAGEDGIDAYTAGDDSDIVITNFGTVRAGTYGIYAYTVGRGSAITIENSGVIDPYTGIYAATDGPDSPISINNDGRVEGDYLGIDARSFGENSGTHTVNRGTAISTGAANSYFHIAIGNLTIGPNSNVVIDNRGVARGYGPAGIGIYAVAEGAGSTTLIVNSGIAYGGLSGARSRSYTGITIVNSGEIYAGPQSQLAIYTIGASTLIYNTGVIRGFVDLTDEDDTFINQAGGTFETKLASDFGLGDDLFVNGPGGTVLAGTDPNARETSAFINLERFENSGLISMVDGRVGDTFEISNTVGGEDLVFAASSGSTLAVDAFLGGPGSQADEFIINGNVTGQTALAVNNTNPRPGVNGAVIPVIEVGGNVQAGAFFLPQPIDTGFFQYDLFFRPTGSGVFELRSFVGGGALLLPQLITGAQDIWHQGSSTWFDRTADLRVLLAGGATPIAYNPNGGYANGPVQGAAMTPAVWARGAGAWLDRDATERVTAFGNTYSFDLGRDLDVIDWQMGLDLGTRDLFSSGDILVFGLLGGFVGASLDYDNIARHFDFSGGQIGGYATYLNGGLFVDTLLNAHLLEMETRTFGFANSLDANTLGLRTDAGYRFGSFNGGAFIEPLATIAVLWSDIDGFTNGGNAVAFDDEANVRGRLGLRVGTSYPVWAGTTIEPFVIGSLWGHLSGDNQATLVSSGTTFRFEDDLDDVWGEVSAGVNFFNPSASTAVFAKLDVTFGDDVDGIGGKAGMRVSW